MATSNTRVAFLGADSFYGQSIIREWAKVNPEQVRQLRSVVHSQGQHAQQALRQVGLNNIKQSDYQNESNLAREIEGCEYAVLCPPVGPEFTKEYATMAVKASKQARVQNMIFLSCLGVDAQNASTALKNCHAIESLVKQHFDNNVVLRINMPAQFFDFCVPTIQESDNLRLNAGNGRFAPIDLADVAKVLSQITRNKSLDNNLIGQVYQLTGPHAINGNELAEAMRKAARGQLPKGYQNISRQEHERELNNIYQNVSATQGQRQQMGGMETRQAGRTQQPQAGKVQGQHEIPATITEKPSMNGYKQTISLFMDYCDLVQKNELSTTTKDVQNLRTQPTPMEEYFKRESQVYNRLA